MKACRSAERWKGDQYGMVLMIVKTPLLNRAILVPAAVRDFLKDEDPDYWVQGDFSLLQVVFPEWHDYILKELEII